MPLQITRELNGFIRNISGLNLGVRCSFAAYQRGERERAIRRLQTIFILITRDDALYHLEKAITVYAGEQRRRAKQLAER
jgi:hypothetical protein